MKNLFLIALVLALYKTIILARHHINDDNVLALIGDTVSCVFYIIVFAFMYYIF